MVLSERLQVLVTPALRARLERVARDRGTSVGAVVRAAVAAYADDDDSGDDLAEIFALELPTSEWAQMKQEIIEAASG